MNYNKIDKIREQKKMPKMRFYELIGMTDTGFRRSVENQSLKVETLQKIAEVLGVPISVFFEEYTPLKETELITTEPWDAASTADMMKQYEGLPDSEVIKLLRQQIAVLKLQLDMTKDLADARQRTIENIMTNKKQ